MRESRLTGQGAHRPIDTPERNTLGAVHSAAQDDGRSLSRRSLLKAAALMLPAASVLGCSKRDAGQSEAVARSQEAAAAPKFFTAEECAFIDAATERLIPDQEDGLGAKGAAVTVFIDRQLAGPYGRAERWYMQGPWEDGIKEQGYQLKLTPAELYRTAIRDIDAWCRKQHGGAFVSLPGADQDSVLHGLENGDVQLVDVPSKVFFTTLWNNTIEGFLADPMYGGNRGFAGWKLVGFPGPRYNYVAEIEQYGKPYTMPTVGIRGRDPYRQETE